MVIFCNFFEKKIKKKQKNSKKIDFFSKKTIFLCKNIDLQPFWGVCNRFATIFGCKILNAIFSFLFVSYTFFNSTEKFKVK